jgi:hypothetical protein
MKTTFAGQNLIVKKAYVRVASMCSEHATVQIVPQANRIKVHLTLRKSRPSHDVLSDPCYSVTKPIPRRPGFLDHILYLNCGDTSAVKRIEGYCNNTP